MALQPGPRVHHDGSMAPPDHGPSESSHAESGRPEPPEGGQELNEIGEDECFALLGRQDLGRLAVVRDGRPEIFPVNYAMDGRTITIRTGSGAKLTYASLAHVAFEVEDIDPVTREGWVVEVRGFAGSPRDQWVVRGGAGVLYTGEYASGTPQEGNLGYGTSGATTGVYNSTTGILSPAFEISSIPVFWTTPTAADLTPGFGAAAPRQPAHTVVTYWAHNHVNGYIYQTSFDIQRQFGGNLLLDVTYLGTFGHSLPVWSGSSGYSTNQVPDADLPLVVANPALAQSLRPFPQYQNVQILDPNIGASKYNGVNVGLQKRYSQGLQFQDYYNPQSRWGLSRSDIRHRLVVSGLYELPFGRGKRFSPSSTVLEEIVGGWSFGTIAELHTGTPLSVIDAVNNTGSFSDGVRPNLVSNPILSSRDRKST